MTAAQAAPDPVEITDAGLVFDLPNDVYHADPVPGGSLSVSGAKRLLPPSCPALFDYERRNGRPPKAAFDLGHAAHDQVLGNGPEIAVIPDDICAVNGAASTKEAKAFIAAARLRGAVPVSEDDWAQVRAMADALRSHPFAGRLFDPARGDSEVSAFTRDEDTGVMLRSRFDFLPHRITGRRLIVPDYKTARSAQPDKFAKTAVDFGYHMQAAWYVDMVRALGIADDVAFVFVVQETTRPYLVSVVQLDSTALRIGRHLNHRAIDLYAQCARAGRWPGYSDDVIHTPLPAWYEHQFEEISQ